MQANTQNKANQSERNKQLIKQTTKTNNGDNIRVEYPRVVASYLWGDGRVSHNRSSSSSSSSSNSKCK